MSRLLAALLMVVGEAAPVRAETPAPVETRAVMQAIFEPMSRILGLSFDDEAFVAPPNRAAIAKDIAALAKNVKLLEQHAKSQDRHFEFVAKSLLRDARRLDRWYARGRFAEARFTLHNMTENCIACHSTFPASRPVPATAAFFAKVAAADLGPLERAHLLVVSRRFDEALAEYESLFRSKDLDPTMITLLGAFTDYLKVAISVQSDFKRPQPVIEHLITRSTTPLHVRQQLERWLLTLKAYQAKSPLAEVSVATAKQVIDAGRALMEFPRDRDGLVHYVTAETMLSRLVRGRQDRGADVAEAYYLLGTVMPMIEHSFWITRTDFYLESAIRLAPAAPFAPKAYALLEENLVEGYSGSGGTHVPDDVRSLLFELKRLVEQERGKI